MAEASVTSCVRSRAAMARLTAVGREVTRYLSLSQIDRRASSTPSDPSPADPASLASSTARDRPPAMAMAGAPLTTMELIAFHPSTQFVMSMYSWEYGITRWSRSCSVARRPPPSARS